VLSPLATVRVRPLPSPRAVALLALTCGSLTVGLASSLPSPRRQADLGAFLVAGRAAAHGLNPYGDYQSILGQPLDGTDVAPVNLNPPVSVLLFQLLAPLDPSILAWSWYTLSLLLVLLCLGLLARTYPARGWSRTAWALSLAGLWLTLQMGQVYPPLLLFTTGAWLALQRQRDLVAGLLLGALVAIKPQFALWPALLFLNGQRRAPLWSLASAALLSLAPLPVYGPAIFAQWLAAQAARSAAYLPADNASLLSLATRLGLPWLGPPLVGLGLLGLAWWAWRCQPDRASLSALALVGALLGSPVTWLGYLLFLLPAWYAAPRLHPWLQLSFVLLSLPAFLLLAGLTALLPPLPPLWSASSLAALALLLFARGWLASARP
jgi:alpha-1,2-mannosyltransferase